jgi:hypothetical protein
MKIVIGTLLSLMITTVSATELILPENQNLRLTKERVHDKEEKNENYSVILLLLEEKGLDIDIFNEKIEKQFPKQDISNEVKEVINIIKAQKVEVAKIK